MFYEKELNFLINILKKSSLSVSIIDPSLPLIESISLGIKKAFGIDTTETTFSDVIGGIEENILYKMTDMFMCRYVFILLPETNKKKCLLIGPYKTINLSNEMIMERAEDLGLMANQLARLEKYYMDTPVIEEDDKIFLTVDAFCDVIWEDSDYTYVNIDKNEEMPFSSLSLSGDVFDVIDPAIEMEVMEKRYAYENQLIDAVSRGQIYKADMFIKSFSASSFEKRLPDTLRNSKNYMIIMNTLLRKAAEKGGVHPLYLDRMSSEYAKEIENFNNVRLLPEFMKKIFEGYCSLVNKHSTKKYSKLIRNVVIYIDSSLADDFSLKSVAKDNGVSASYLSKTFKEETGKNFVDYVNDKRINFAKHLLKTTNLQVQTVAQYCGFMDMQYFSKVFKKYTERTPREYREKKRMQNT